MNEKNNVTPPDGVGVREALESAEERLVWGMDSAETSLQRKLAMQGALTFIRAALSPRPTAGREEIALTLYDTRFPHRYWSMATTDERALTLKQADAILAIRPSPSAEPVAWQQGIDLLREVQGYAQANTDAARTQDGQDTWRAHWRNVTRAVDLLSMVAAQSPASPVSDARGREALETAKVVCSNIAADVLQYPDRQDASEKIKSVFDRLLSPTPDKTGGGK